MVFGDDAIVDGLSPLTAVREGNVVVLEFDPAMDELVVIGDGKPATFELCTDESCAYVDARLQQNRILLSAKEARTATRVRHCWADAPICNLYGTSGLPVASFEIEIRPE
jgi:sialate O-acetylesterase